MKTKHFVTSLFALVAMLTSCGDLLESSNNGKLDGNWNLVAIDTLESGGVADLRTDRKFWAVQGKLLEMHDADVGTAYIFQFTFDGSQLTLFDARYNRREEGDPAVADLHELAPFGINASEEQFKVEFPSRDKMMLTSAKLRLTFRRF